MCFRVVINVVRESRTFRKKRRARLGNTPTRTNMASGKGREKNDEGSAWVEQCGEDTTGDEVNRRHGSTAATATTDLLPNNGAE